MKRVEPGGVKKKPLKKIDRPAALGTENPRTLSGIPIEPVYTPKHTSRLDYNRDLGDPGRPPFTRGVHETMYRGRPWTMRQLAGFGPPEETNKRFKFLLKQGATGLNAVFDYPTLRGYDSIHPAAEADAGRGGAAIDTIDDMAELFEGIPLDALSVSLVTCQPLCNITLQSMYFANASRLGLDTQSLRGTSQNDFLMETVVTAAPDTLLPAASFRLCCDAIEYCRREAGLWNPVSFAGYNYREAGCTAAQEAALVLANAVACVEELVRRGLNVDDFAPRLSFFFSAHSDFFEEIAKYRAARRIWSRIMSCRFKAKNPRSCALRFHVQTAGMTLTARQPLNNITRAAYQALSAVLGGAQSLHVDAYDEALCIPTELSSLTALRTQQILLMETGVAATADPLGGSFFVETLTNDIEERILAVMEEIEDRGGLVEAVNSGWAHRVIAESAYAYQKAVDNGKVSVVGSNCHQIGEELMTPELFALPGTVEVQRRKIEAVKRERDPKAVGAALSDIAKACRGGKNLMAAITAAVDKKPTLGEISAVIKENMGTWNPPLFDSERRAGKRGGRRRSK